MSKVRTRVRNENVNLGRRKNLPRFEQKRKSFKKASIVYGGIARKENPSSQNNFPYNKVDYKLDYPLNLNSDKSLENFPQPIKIGNDITGLSIAQDYIKLTKELVLDSSVGIRFDGSGGDIINSTIKNSLLIEPKVSGNLIVAGDIIIDDGGSIKEAGGTAAITIDGAGEVSKIGQDTPSDGQVLTWDNGNSKVVWETNAASAGATALDELSDVTYSSGDLTIASLDTIYLPSTSSTTIQTKGKLLFRDWGAGATFDFLEIDEDNEIIILNNDTCQLKFYLSVHDSIISTESSGTSELHITSTDGLYINTNVGDIYFQSGGLGSAVTQAFFDMSYVEDLKIYNKFQINNPSDVGDDYFNIVVADKGATTISTVDDAGFDADLTLNADGDILLESANSSIDMNSTLTIDKDYSIATATTTRGLYVDYDRTGDVSSGTDYNYGIDIDMDVTGGSGGVQLNYGMQINLTSDNMGSGISGATGILITNTGADVCNGIAINNKDDAGQDFINKSSEGAANDYFYINTITCGVTTIGTNDHSAALAHLNIEANGHVEFDGCAVGFDRILYADAADVTVDFRTGNKAHLDMTGGSISGALTLQFPDTSGNFVLVVEQDLSTRTIANWSARDLGGATINNDGGTAGLIRWAGGSTPTLTAGGGKRDVISFYWDSDDEVCYGVASLDFSTDE